MTEGNEQTRVAPPSGGAFFRLGWSYTPCFPNLAWRLVRDSIREPVQHVLAQLARPDQLRSHAVISFAVTPRFGGIWLARSPAGNASRPFSYSCTTSRLCVGRALFLLRLDYPHQRVSCFTSGL